ncbi:Acetyl-CoA carboxylase biotin carboxyl carrier protein subunit [Planctomycetales bacterium 10988]|nr:Acetyl-CoA carboxylase biotin carboxyl carrier protein subunit [Planctomycetales bacterium 10988]
MSDKKTTSDPQLDTGDIFDIRNFRRLVKIMQDYEVNELSVKRGDRRMRVRRGAPVAPIAPIASAQPLPPAAAPASSAPASATPAAPAETPAADDNHLLIKAEAIGTFYSAPDPDSPAFVKVGDHVGPETIVCLIEAMKVFNEVSAQVSGKVVSILVNNGDPVEFGQPLFKIDPNG